MLGGSGIKRDRDQRDAPEANQAADNPGFLRRVLTGARNVLAYFSPAANPEVERDSKQQRVESEDERAARELEEQMEQARLQREEDLQALFKQARKATEALSIKHPKAVSAMPTPSVATTKVLEQCGQRLLSSYLTGSGYYASYQELFEVDPKNYFSNSELAQILQGIENDPNYINAKPTIDQKLITILEALRADPDNKGLLKLNLINEDYACSHHLNETTVGKYGQHVGDLIVSQTGKQIHQCKTIEEKRKALIDFTVTVLSSNNPLEVLPKPPVHVLEKPALREQWPTAFDRWIEQAGKAAANSNTVVEERSRSTP
jgi:hypothetical protein